MIKRQTFTIIAVFFVLIIYNIGYGQENTATQNTPLHANDPKEVSQKKKEDIEKFFDNKLFLYKSDQYVRNIVIGTIFQTLGFSGFAITTPFPYFFNFSSTRLTTLKSIFFAAEFSGSLTCSISGTKFQLLSNQYGLPNYYDKFFSHNWLLFVLGNSCKMTGGMLFFFSTTKRYEFCYKIVGDAVSISGSVMLLINCIINLKETKEHRNKLQSSLSASPFFEQNNSVGFYIDYKF